tara:strand:- start:911 stop:1054 length:144 start_codon:yes stop_codon:yes gene_type:complete
MVIGESVSPIKKSLSFISRTELSTAFRLKVVIEHTKIVNDKNFFIII